MQIGKGREEGEMNREKKREKRKKKDRGDVG